MSEQGAVGAYYDQRAQSEWERLQGNWLEYAVTRHVIDRYLRPSSRILDVGGGPGRYAIDLTAAGHKVALADLSEANVALAESKAAEAGLRLLSARQVDARELSGFADASFDAVLNLGPLYHLIEEADRVRAVEESLRVLRPGGCAFFAFLSRCAPLYFLLKTAADEIEAKSELVKRVQEQGLYRPSAGEDFFIDAVFDDPEAVEPFMSRFVMERLDFFGAESVMTQSEGLLRALPEAARETWLGLAFDLAATPAALHASEHLVFVGLKPG